MADHDPPVDVAALPQAVAEPPRRSRVSLVWLVPLVALAIAGWLAWHTLSQRGPTVTILFADAEGIEAGKTRVRYKSVDVGTVTAVELTPDRKLVRVLAELRPDTEDWLVEDSRFWVVRPRVGAAGVSGLGTLLSGAYIGMEVGKSDDDAREFRGLDVPPIVTEGLPGRQFVLRADVLGSLERGTPVFFRRIPVGQVIAYRLIPGGGGVEVQIFVDAPYDQYVTQNARFWHASGIDIELSASGVNVRTESLASIIGGGIAFQAPPGDALAPPAEAGAAFRLFQNRTEAIAPDPGRIDRYVVYFSESVRGLAPGAPVEFRGIPLGVVRDIAVEFDFESQRFRIPVAIDLYPDKLASRAIPGVKQQQIGRREALDALIAKGFRAQLRTGNLVTGQLYVALDLFPNAPKAGIDWSAEPAILPSMPGALTEAQESIGGILRKIEKVPFDRIGADVEKALASLDATLKRVEQLAANVDRDLAPEMRATLVQAQQTLAAAERTVTAAQGTVGADGALATELRDAIRELTRTMQSLRALTDYLERHPEALIRGKRPEGTP
jgi:paraquat-inducible protein B